jgi:DNA-directed RNA polymerase subunit K/omega
VEILRTEEEKGFKLQTISMEELKEGQRPIQRLAQLAPLQQARKQ